MLPAPRRGQRRGHLPLLLATCAACLLLHGVAGYYVPGTYPQEFRVGDPLSAYVNSLTSFDTELPFEYYTMPFCKPAEGVKRAANTANPGTVLQGLRIETSPYNFTVQVNMTAQLVCKPSGYYGPLTKDEVKNIKHKIDNRYRVNMVLDNLPVTVYDLLKNNEEFVRPGFELGFEQDGKYFINNHLIFNILVYPTHGEYSGTNAQYQSLLAAEAIDNRRRGLQELQPAGQGRALLGDDDKNPAAAPAADASAAAAAPPAYFMVVGFEVAPCSIKREAGKPVTDQPCGMEEETRANGAQEVTLGAKIVYTYDVYWEVTDRIKWATRWDAYLRMPGGKVHWFSIFNSLLVSLVMASIVALILIRTVRRDLAKYEALMMDSGTAPELKEEAGWKLLTGDAFRAPARSSALAVQVGSGAQIILTATTTLLLATLGLLSPAARGALLTTAMVLYVLLSVVAGLVGVYVWGAMERTYAGWPTVCLKVSVFYPGLVMAVFTLLNLVIHHTGSTGAVPVGMYFSLVAVWFVVSIPLAFVGGYAALRLPVLDNPVKTNQIPRHVPPPPLSANPTLLFLAAGILPFGTMFIELYFAMTSIWGGYFYYLFGFVFLIGLLSVLIAAEISVLCTYVQLCAEDYAWWWASFRRGGSVTLYITLFAASYLISSLKNLAGGIPVFVYICHMTILILGTYFAFGTVGFLSSWWFVHAIFRAIKAD